MNAELILIRHAAVADRYLGRCYGVSDVELSLDGEEHSRELSELLAAGPVARVIHSGLQRTRFLAEKVAERLSCPLESCRAIQERDFGDWELELWDQLHQQFGNEMLRMISDPAAYRPGGGETTFEMRDRVLKWFDDLPKDGRTIAVTHGGPIAVLRGMQAGLPVAGWLDLIPACGEWVLMNFPDTVHE